MCYSMVLVRFVVFVVFVVVVVVVVFVRVLYLNPSLLY